LVKFLCSLEYTCSVRKRPSISNFENTDGFEVTNSNLSTDIVKPKDDGVCLCVGAEWLIWRAIALRAGYNNNHGVGREWSTGLGSKFGEVWFRSHISPV